MGIANHGGSGLDEIKAETCLLNAHIEWEDVLNISE